MSEGEGRGEESVAGGEAGLLGESVHKRCRGEHSLLLEGIC